VLLFAFESNDCKYSNSSLPGGRVLRVVSEWTVSRPQRGRGCDRARYDNGPQPETGRSAAYRQIIETYSTCRAPV